MTVFVNMRGWISVFSHLFVFRNNYEEIIRINHSDVLKHNPFSLPSKQSAKLICLLAFPTIYHARRRFHDIGGKCNITSTVRL